MITTICYLEKYLNRRFKNGGSLLYKYKVLSLAYVIRLPNMKLYKKSIKNWNQSVWNQFLIIYSFVINVFGSLTCKTVKKTLKYFVSIIFTGHCWSFIYRHSFSFLWLVQFPYSNDFFCVAPAGRDGKSTAVVRKSIGDSSLQVNINAQTWIKKHFILIGNSVYNTSRNIFLPMILLAIRQRATFSLIAIVFLQLSITYLSEQIFLNNAVHLMFNIVMVQVEVVLTVQLYLLLNELNLKIISIWQWRWEIFKLKE